MEIHFGKTYEVAEIDDTGSVMEAETTYLGGVPIDKRLRVERRIKVSSQQEELSSYLQFRDETRNLRNAEFRIEYSAKANKEGSYYVVWAYCVRKA